MKKEYIFIGPPGSGKGTQTIMLSEEYNIPHIDTGALLRAEVASGSEEGKLADAAMKQGHLVPIDVVAKIIKKRLMQNDSKNGFILDGYPRSMEQALALDKVFEEIDGTTKTDRKVFYFDVDNKILTERLVNRRSCPKCGAIYNIKTTDFNSSKCPKCNVDLVQRKDDTAEIAKERFATYYNETHPLIELYTKRNLVSTIDASQSVSEVYQQLKEVIEKECQ